MERERCGGTGRGGEKSVVDIEEWGKGKREGRIHTGGVVVGFGGGGGGERGQIG